MHATRHGCRVVIVGAGSAVFGPGLIAGAIRRPTLTVSTIILLGHTPERLEITRALANRMVAEAGARLLVEATLDPAEALDGADFVISAISVGGLAARRIDVEVPLEYGVVQTKGDSAGPGGLSRALRTVPPLLEIARQMERRCPDAWFLNYSNPLTPVCRALSRETRVKVVGLCDGVSMARAFLAGYLGVPPERLTTRCAGVNHASWLTELRLDGQDAYARLRERLGQVGATAEPVSFELLRLYGLYPSPADVHVAEFFPHFLNVASQGGQAWGLSPWPADEFIQARAAAEEVFRQRARGLLPLEPVTAAVGEAAMAMDLIAAMDANAPMDFTANLPNAGQLRDLPEGAIVEMPAVANGETIRGLTVGGLPPGITAFCRARLGQQELVVEAALSGDRQVALQALLADPLMSSVTTGQALEMLDRLLAAHEAYLPQFYRKDAL
ncbi:MAG: hypothetical protein HYY04_07050 [Chloroflexi bacterium]|nr:hypothetical protein [Chloroflexota bacterium]